MPSWSSKVASIAKPSQEQQDTKSEDNSRIGSAATKIQVGEHASPMAKEEENNADDKVPGGKVSGKSNKKLDKKGDQESGFKANDKEGSSTSKLGGLFKRNKDKKDKKTNKDNQQPQPFFLSGTSNAIAVRIKELDECCCADVPCISIVKEYCESSSLHGLRYITEDGRHWTERVLWIILCLCGFILTIYFIYPIWAKWNEKPTITTLDSTDHPVWEIDFPAITVCPANKVDKVKMAKIARKEPWRSMVSSEEELETIIRFLIQSKGLESSSSTSSDLSDWPGLSEKVEQLGLANLTFLMANVMPSCSSFILRCWWQGRVQDCGEIFQVRKTNDGFCCSFNALRPSETVDLPALKNAVAAKKLDDLGIIRLMEQGLREFVGKEDEEDMVVGGRKNNNEQTEHVTKEKATEKTTIRRLNSANHQRGLTIVLDSKSEEYNLVADDFVGFKILIHHPGSYPEVEGHTVTVGAGREYFVGVTATHTEGSKAVLDFPFEGRSCLFRSEREFSQSEVKIYKDYTQENCLLECRSRLLLQLCGCLPYYYPRLDLLMTESDVGKNATAKCTWLGWQCLKNHTELLDAIKPEFPPIRDHGSGRRSQMRREREEEQMRQRETLIKGGAPCQCQPACATTIYGATQSSAGFPSRASRIAAEVLRDVEGSHSSDLSMVHVFFRDLKVFKYHTDELFSWENILASFGGLIGLCTGFSFLSAAEFAYFFTLRCTLPICRKRKRQDKVAMLNADNDLVVVKVEE